MKVIPLDLDLESVEALKKAASDAERVEAKAKLDALLAAHTPPGGWPAKTIAAANEEVHITADMRRDAAAHAKAITKTIPKRDLE